MAKQSLKFYSSWDDGHNLDLKLANLLLYFGLPGIFYIPSNHKIGDEQLLEIARNFEIGGHTISHPEDLKILDDLNLKLEIEGNKFYLEETLEKKITQFCYPSGRYDERVRQAVAEADFLGARNTIVLKNHPRNGDPFQIETSIHIFQRQEYKNKTWFEVAKEQARLAAKNKGYFHIWGHSWEINKYNQWTELEKFFSWLKKNFDLKFETLDTLCHSLTSKKQSMK
jgi:peptidoglycan/xylan/chitin deacetylase (PgdA/CDA1 family)